MSSLNLLSNTISNLIEKYIEDRFEKFLLSFGEGEREKLEEAWKESDNSEAKPKIVKEKKTLKAERKEVPGESQDGEGCPYVASRGAKEGQRCGVKSKSGSTYCSTHKKYEGVGQKDRVVPSAPKIKTSSRSTSISSIASRGKEKKIDTTRRVVDHPETGEKWHPESKIVFKIMGDSILASGKIVNDKVVKLTRDDVECLKKWQFPFNEKDIEEQPKLEKKEKKEKKVEKKTEKQTEKKTEKKEESEDDSDIETEFNTLNSKEGESDSD